MMWITRQFDPTLGDYLISSQRIVTERGVHLRLTKRFIIVPHERYPNRSTLRHIDYPAVLRAAQEEAGALTQVLEATEGNVAEAARRFHRSIEDLREAIARRQLTDLQWDRLLWGQAMRILALEGPAAYEQFLIESGLIERLATVMQSLGLEGQAGGAIPLTVLAAGPSTLLAAWARVAQRHEMARRMLGRLQVTEVDVVQAMLDAGAAIRALRVPEVPVTMLRESMIERLSMAEGSQQIVVLAFGLSQLLTQAQRRRAFEEAYRLLQPDGVLVLLEPQRILNRDALDRLGARVLLRPAANDPIVDLVMLQKTGASLNATAVQELFPPRPPQLVAEPDEPSPPPAPSAPHTHDRYADLPQLGITPDVHVDFWMRLQGQLTMRELHHLFTDITDELFRLLEVPTPRASASLEQRLELFEQSTSAPRDPSRAHALRPLLEQLTQRVQASQEHLTPTDQRLARALQGYLQRLIRRLMAVLPLLLIGVGVLSAALGGGVDVPFLSHWLVAGTIDPKKVRKAGRIEELRRLYGQRELTRGQITTLLSRYQAKGFTSAQRDAVLRRVASGDVTDQDRAVLLGFAPVSVSRYRKILEAQGAILPPTHKLDLELLAEIARFEHLTPAEQERIIERLPGTLAGRGMPRVEIEQWVEMLRSTRVKEDGLTEEEIASFFGVEDQTISSAIRELERTGTITYSRKDRVSAKKLNRIGQRFDVLRRYYLAQGLRPKALRGAVMNALSEELKLSTREIQNLLNRGYFARSVIRLWRNNRTVTAAKLIELASELGYLYPSRPLPRWWEQVRDTISQGSVLLLFVGFGLALVAGSLAAPVLMSLEMTPGNGPAASPLPEHERAAEWDRFFKSAALTSQTLRQLGEQAPYRAALIHVARAYSRFHAQMPQDMAHSFLSMFLMETLIPTLEHVELTPRHVESVATLLDLEYEQAQQQDPAGLQGLARMLLDRVRSEDLVPDSLSLVAWAGSGPDGFNRATMVGGILMISRTPIPGHIVSLLVQLTHRPESHALAGRVGELLSLAGEHPQAVEALLSRLATLPAIPLRVLLSRTLLPDVQALLPFISMPEVPASGTPQFTGVPIERPRWHIHGDLLVAILLLEAKYMALEEDGQRLYPFLDGEETRETIFTNVMTALIEQTAEVVQQTGRSLSLIDILTAYHQAVEGYPQDAPSPLGDAASMWIPASSLATGSSDWLLLVGVLTGLFTVIALGRFQALPISTTRYLLALVKRFFVGILLGAMVGLPMQAHAGESRVPASRPPVVTPQQTWDNVWFKLAARLSGPARTFTRTIGYVVKAYEVELPQMIEPEFSRRRGASHRQMASYLEEVVLAELKSGMEAHGSHPVLEQAARYVEETMRTLQRDASRLRKQGAPRQNTIAMDRRQLEQQLRALAERLQALLSTIEQPGPAPESPSRVPPTTEPPHRAPRRRSISIVSPKSLPKSLPLVLLVFVSLAAGLANSSIGEVWVWASPSVLGLVMPSGLSGKHLVIFLPFGNELNGVTLYHRELVGRLLEASSDIRISVVHDRARSPEAGHYQRRQNLLIEASPGLWTMSSSTLQRLLAAWHTSRPIDVILMHSVFGPDAQAVVELARQLGLPLRAFVHVEEIDSETSSTLRTVDSVATNSEFMARQLAGWGIAAQVIDPLMDLRAWSPELVSPPDVLRLRRRVGLEDTFVVLAAGRAVPSKDLFRVVEWTGMVLRGWHGPRLAVVMALLDPERAPLAEWHAQAQKRGVDLILLPPQAPEQLRVWYRPARVVMIPSLREAFGRVAVEAQAMGTPVIVTNAGGLPATVHPTHGITIAPGDDARAVLALQRLLPAGLFRSRVVRAGEAYVRQRFGYDHTPEVVQWLLRGPSAGRYALLLIVLGLVWSLQAVGYASPSTFVFVPLIGMLSDEGAEVLPDPTRLDEAVALLEDLKLHMEHSEARSAVRSIAEAVASHGNSTHVDQLLRMLPSLRSDFIPVDSPIPAMARAIGRVGMIEQLGRYLDTLPSSLYSNLEMAIAVLHPAGQGIWERTSPDDSQAYLDGLRPQLQSASELVQHAALTLLGFVFYKELDEVLKRADWSARGRSELPTLGVEVEVHNVDKLLELQTPPTDDPVHVLSFLAKVREALGRIPIAGGADYYWNVHFNIGLTKEHMLYLANHKALIYRVIHLLFYAKRLIHLNQV